MRAVELAGKQRELYETIRVAAHDKVRAALRKRGLAASTVTILAALTRLRQLCCDPRLLGGAAAGAVQESAKFDLLMQFIPEQIGAGAAHPGVLAVRHHARADRARPARAGRHAQPAHGRDRRSRATRCRPSSAATPTCS